MPVSAVAGAPDFPENLTCKSYAVYKAPTAWTSDSGSGSLGCCAAEVESEGDMADAGADDRPASSIAEPSDADKATVAASFKEYWQVEDLKGQLKRLGGLEPSSALQIASITKCMTAAIVLKVRPWQE